MADALSEAPAIGIATLAVFSELKDVYPGDAEFENQFRMKTERTNQKAQYFLRILEIKDQQKTKGKMANEMEPAALTVEHILPKSPGADWSGIVSKDPEIVDECVNRLGNLCLLTDVNAKLGNKGFTTKKATFGKSELLTTKSLSKLTAWDRAAIDARQNYQAIAAKGIWRYP